MMIGRALDVKTGIDPIYRECFIVGVKMSLTTRRRLGLYVTQ